MYRDIDSHIMIVYIVMVYGCFFLRFFFVSFCPHSAALNRFSVSLSLLVQFFLSNHFLDDLKKKTDNLKTSQNGYKKQMASDMGHSCT